MITQATFEVTIGCLEINSERELEQIRRDLMRASSSVAAMYNGSYRVNIHNIKGVLIHDPSSE